MLPTPGDLVPRRRFGALEALGRLSLRISGWRIVGPMPNLPHAIAVVAPHSSNWDFVHGISAVLALRLKVQFLAKHTLFRGMLGGIMRWLGGVPVNRADPQDLAERVAESIRRTDNMWLGITPEGTRTAGRSFKSGFLRIARVSGVPIVPVSFNYRTRVIEFHPVFQPGDDPAADLQALSNLLLTSGCRREHARQPG
ncbi:MAG: 1-acyl-sn-glycerol-3-phosphate acyltransferase [Quisquiliibacterium sp.]